MKRGDRRIGTDGGMKRGEGKKRKRGERTGGTEEGRREEDKKRREERDARVSYCQCNFEDCLLVQLMG